MSFFRYRQPTYKKLATRTRFCLVLFQLYCTIDTVNKHRQHFSANSCGKIDVQMLRSLRVVKKF